MNDDRELIDKCIGGDEDAVERLVIKYQKMVYSFAYRIVNDMEEAKDIAQISFIKAVQGLKGFKKEASFRTWLYRIVLNTALNHKRKGSFREVTLDESIAVNQTGALSLIIREERRNLIKKSLDKLPGQQRLAVTLRVYEGLSCNEASKVMGCSVSTVKAHYHFGVKKLKEILSYASD